MSHQHHKAATVVGCLALLCWSAGSSLLSALRSIPVFELLTISLGISFFITASKLTIQKRWYLIKKPHWSIWLVGVLGLFGNDLFLVTATKFAPPAHVHLINYTWPTIILLFSGLLPGEKCLYRYLIAALLGFYGVYLLICSGDDSGSFLWEYRYGYLSALLAAFVWSMYSLILRHKGKKTPSEMIGMYCGIGAIFSSCNHLYYESFVMPTNIQWVCLILIGITTSCLAFYFWDYGYKFGNFRLLSLLSYLSPLVGLCLLYLLGKTELTSSLLVASAFIIGAPLISLLSYERMQHWLRSISWDDSLLDRYLSKN